jgi:hypothetical protein
MIINGGNKMTHTGHTKAYALKLKINFKPVILAIFAHGFDEDDALERFSNDEIKTEIMNNFGLLQLGDIEIEHAEEVK